MDIQVNGQAKSVTARSGAQITYSVVGGTPGNTVSIICFPTAMSFPPPQPDASTQYYSPFQGAVDPAGNLSGSDTLKTGALGWYSSEIFSVTAYDNTSKVFASSKVDVIVTTRTSQPEVPPEILNELGKWKRNSSILRGLHISLGSTAIVLSVVVASQVHSLDPGIIAWLAAGAAIATGSLTGFDLGTKANEVRRAWRLLNASVMSYQEDPNYSVEDLISAYSQAENMIGDVRENPMQQ